MSSSGLSLLLQVLIRITSWSSGVCLLPGSLLVLVNPHQFAECSQVLLTNGHSLINQFLFKLAGRLLLWGMLRARNVTSTGPAYISDFVNDFPRELWDSNTPNNSQNISKAWSVSSTLAVPSRPQFNHVLQYSCLLPFVTNWHLEFQRRVAKLLKWGK